MYIIEMQRIRLCDALLDKEDTQEMHTKSRVNKISLPDKRKQHRPEGNTHI